MARILQRFYDDAPGQKYSLGERVMFFVTMAGIMTIWPWLLWRKNPKTLMEWFCFGLWMASLSTGVICTIFFSWGWLGLPFAIQVIIGCVVAGVAFGTDTRD